MAKAKKNERGKVKLGLKDLTNPTRIMLDRLDNMISSYGDMGLTANELLEIGQALQDECGGDANAWICADDYFGNSVDMKWSRPETDEEWAKRLEANKNKAAGQRKKRAADKKQKVLDEKAELARLQEKYSEET